MPVWQVSVCVHPLPSLHAVPSVWFGLVHMPVAGMQVPAVWHWSLAVQVTGLEPVHVPAWQVSLCVHSLPSLQTVLSAWLGLVHMPVVGMQVPAVLHWSRAVQVTGLAPVQVPAWQVSLVVQALPSLQARPSALGGLEHVPVVVLQVPA